MKNKRDLSALLILAVTMVLMVLILSGASTWITLAVIIILLSLIMVIGEVGYLLPEAIRSLCSIINGMLK